MSLKILMAVIVSIQLAMVANTVHAHNASYVTSGINQATTFKNTIISLRNQHRNIDEITISPNGEWIVVYNTSIYRSAGFPASVKNKVQAYINAGKEIDVIAFAPNGSWIVVAEDYFWRSANVPEGAKLQNYVKKYQNAGKRIDSLALSNNGWIVVSGNNSASWNVPASLRKAVADRIAAKRKVTNISLTPDNKWIVVEDQWFASNNITKSMMNTVKEWQRSKRKLDHLVIGPGSSFVAYGGSFNPSSTSKIDQIEYKLGALKNKNIYQRMKDLKINGLSLAIIDNNSVVYARGYGVLEKDSQDWVRNTSPFSVGSNSKLVAAMTAMKLIDQGNLSLATNLNNAGGIVNWWKFLGINYPKSYGTFDYLDQSKTLEQLLSHTAGMKNSSIQILPDCMNNEPSVLQMMLGYNCIDGNKFFDNTRVAWADQNVYPVGSTFKYSNKGYAVAQGMIQGLEGNDYKTVVKNKLFIPLGINNATYDQFLGNGWFAKVAKKHDGNGNKIAQRLIPNHAAGGLYIAPKDYARLMVLLLNNGQTKSGVQVLSADSVNEILNVRQSKYGLGVRVHNAANYNSMKFRHGGTVTGGSSCMEGFPAQKEGIFIVVNGNKTNGWKLMTEIKEAFQLQYGWSHNDTDKIYSC
ncbi:MAG: beta-lactamase family protein [Gammaproteobacteria bacterium]|nr:beta-lactamase family protein [Gammaproteobacteria bacterium]